MNIKNDYPKAWEAYKAYLLDKYDGDKRIAEFITDETLELSLKSTPMSAAQYFDIIGMIGTYDYCFEDKCFEMKVNGEPVDVHEDHQYSNDRREIEINLIKYLFSEVEKTL